MKALILSTHTGGGHDAAARAIEEALTKRGVTCRLMDCVAFGGRWFSKCVSGVYVKWVQVVPDSFGAVYKLGRALSTKKMKSPIYLVNASYARRMERLLEEFQPDMIVCTHLFGGQSVTHLRRHHLYRGLLALVMTDYTIHPFSEDVECDLLFIHRTAAEESQRLHLPEGAVQQTGIPVSQSCQPCQDKRTAKQALGLNPDQLEVLLVGGSMGAGNLPEAIRHVLPALGTKGHLTVVCGSNEKARAHAEEAYGSDPRVTVQGRVSPLSPWIAAADVLVTKSGGLTSTEAMTIGVPIVILRPIAGCETANATFMTDKGLALWAHDDMELQAHVTALLADETLRQRMIAAQRREIDPNCADHVADILIRHAKEKGKTGDAGKD